MQHFGRGTLIGVRPLVVDGGPVNWLGSGDSIQLTAIHVGEQSPSRGIILTRCNRSDKTLRTFAVPAGADVSGETHAPRTPPPTPLDATRLLTTPQQRSEYIEDCPAERVTR
jgi:hypothetical protein